MTTQLTEQFWASLEGIVFDLSVTEESRPKHRPIDFAAEVPPQANQWIPTAQVMNAITREAASETKQPNDNEAVPTETKMNANETNSASEANENEGFPVRPATQAEREAIYGVHTAEKREPQALWICEPLGAHGLVRSSTPEHALAMAKKAVANLAANRG